MAKVKFNKAVITGISTFVPPKIRSFDEDAALFHADPKQLARIKKNIGLDKRHVADENTTTLNLCHAAAKDLLINLKLSKGDIDGLIFVTQTPDHIQPCNAAIIHGHLGLGAHCASFDVNLGCSGYVYGLWLAHMMIETGSCRRVLLLAGDTLSKCVNARDRSVGPLFGDGGSATIIEYSDDSPATYFSLHTDGSGAEHIKIPAGGFRLPKSIETAKEIKTEDGNIYSDNDLQMNGGEVFNFSISTEPQAITEILEFADIEKDSIDYIFFHQANKYIIGNIIRRLKIPKEKAPSNTVEKYGNQSSASIPATINNTLYDAEARSLQKVIFSGFGVGLSWASCLTTLNLAYCSPVKIYNEG